MKKVCLIILVSLSLLSSEMAFASVERELEDAITNLWLSGADERIEKILETYASSPIKLISSRAQFHLLCLKILGGDSKSANELLNKLEASAETREEKEYVSKLRRMIVERNNSSAGDRQLTGKISLDAENIPILPAGLRKDYIRKEIVLSHTDPRNAEKILKSFFFEKTSDVFLKPKENSLALEGPQDLVEGMIKALEVHDGNAVSIIGRGNDLKNNKKYEEAINAYKEAIRIAPKNYVPWSNMASMFEEQCKYEEAIECYDKVLEIVPNDSCTLARKGDLLKCLTKFEDAMACLDAAIHADPGNISAWATKGEILMERSRFEEALKCFDKSLESSNNGYTLAEKGELLIMMNKDKDAMACLDAAIRAEPGLPQSWSFKGDILARQSRFEEAIKCYDKAVELYPQFGGNYLKKGKVFFQLKKFDEAIKMYDRAISLDPDLPEIKKLREEAILAKVKK